MDISKPGTTLHYVLRLSREDGSKFIQKAIEDYKQLFFYDRELKKVVFDRLKDPEEKEFKKFVLSLTQPYFEDIGKLLKHSGAMLDSESLGIALSVVFKDYKTLQDHISAGIKNFSLMDQCKKLTFDSLRQHIDS
jgi:hypothetical protein